MSITPKNWDTFQHYTDRKPSWIKLHRALLDDYHFSCLPVASRALAPCLWLLASEYEAGKITADFDEIAFRLRMTKGELCEALNPLIEAGFFKCDSAMLADRKQDAIPEKRDIENIEKTETEKNTSLRSDFPSDFREQFWAAYPSKKGKAAALNALETIRKRGAVPWATLIDGVRAYAATADPQFTKHPKTWLSQGCWDDEPDMRKPHGKASIIDATQRLIDGIEALGPRPSLIRSTEGQGSVRLLSNGGSERPRDIHGGNRGNPIGISGGGDSACDRSENGNSAEDQVLAERS